MTPRDASDIEELKSILKQVGPENIWRPVVTPDNQRLSEGIGDDRDGLAMDLNGLAFSGKTVVDLGCNLGFYSFLVRRAGAAAVLGIDIDPRVIRGSEILAHLFRVHHVAFRVQDITALSGSETFTVGMMIDFIGKNMVRCGLYPRFLDALERVSEQEMILSVRPVYRVRKHLRGDVAGLLEHYPRQYLRGDHFLAMDYAVDRFSSRWRVRVVDPKNDPEGVIKETLHFTRRTPVAS